MDLLFGNNNNSDNFEHVVEKRKSKAEIPNAIPEKAQWLSASPGIQVCRFGESSITLEQEGTLALHGSCFQV